MTYIRWGYYLMQRDEEYFRGKRSFSLDVEVPPNTPPHALVSHLVTSPTVHRPPRAGPSDEHLVLPPCFRCVTGHHSFRFTSILAPFLAR